MSMLCCSISDKLFDTPMTEATIHECEEKATSIYKDLDNQIKESLLPPTGFESSPAGKESELE